MTSSRYFLARVAQSFGINRRSKRMSDAAFETHLLREAEQILGEDIWEATEPVEELSVEYWNLRKLDRERRELDEKLEVAEEVLAAAHEERAVLLNEVTDAQQELEEQKASLAKKLEVIARERDEVVRLAKEVRRQYDGLKTKLSVLTDEQGDGFAEEIRAAKQRMAALRKDFQKLKEKRAEIGERLGHGDALLLKVEGKLGERRQVRRDEAAKTFSVIGKANRDISNHRAQIGLIETRQQQLYGEIGRHVSRHVRSNQGLAQIYRENQTLVDIMSALRRSIMMNRKLTSTY